MVRSPKFLGATCGALLLCALPAGAGELPPWFAPPPGWPVVRVDGERYGFVELSYRDPAGASGTVHAEPRGRTWRVQLRPPPGGRPAQMAPSLREGGWELLSTDPVVVGRHLAGGHEAWLVSSFAGMVSLVEKGPPRRIELAPPAAVPEELIRDADPPWFTTLPGLRRERWLRAEDAGCDVRNPVLKGIDYAGPPRVEIRYAAPPADVSSLELQEAYVDALGRAGWAVLSTGRANNTTAHYTRDGRDLWLHLSPAPGALGLCIADVGAAAAAARLKQALDDAGHVAVYGIYFDVDKSTLRPEAEPTLQQIRALLAAQPALRLEIQGHTDDTGGHAHNQPLSEQRAAAVKAWLAAHAIDGARLTTAGYAETRPVAPNATPEGRQKNRRVELARR